MKRIVLLLTISIVSLSSISSIAQGIGLGIKAGANFADQSITDINTKNRTGFNGGAYLTLAWSEKWAIQPEFLFSSQGSELPDVNDIIQLDYFSIPILLRWKPIGILSIHTGPQFSSLLSAVDKSGENIKEDFKNSDFGYTLGAEVHIPFGLRVGGRYIWGFTNVSDLDEDLSVKNQTLQLYAAWTIFGQK